MIIDAKRAIKNVLATNKASLTAGIELHGKERTIHHITTSRGTPPRAYYYISIHARPIRRMVKMAAANSPIDFKKRVYGIEISLIDYLMPETGEDQLYEKATENFDTLTDRIMDLIENTSNFISGSSRFILVDPFSIEADPAIVNWEEAEAYHHVAVTDITFEIEEC